MSAKSSIEWTDATWNPIVGCERVSPGCDNCYAARDAHGRLRNVPAYKGLTRYGDIRRGAVPEFTGEIRLLPERLDQPLHWKQPRRIFVNSMSDLFHPAVPSGFICQVFEVMGQANQHTFQVLTKRPQRMAEMLTLNRPDPFPNIWLGTSIESQTYSFRARHLLNTPAAVRFVSAEPLLGPVDLRPYLDRSLSRVLDERPPAGVDWVIVGGESGPKSRPMHPDWARDLRDQCQEFDVAFHFKQWGEWGPALLDDPGPYHEWTDGSFSARHGKRLAGRLLDGREWNEYPA